MQEVENAYILGMGERMNSEELNALYHQKAQQFQQEISGSVIYLDEADQYGLMWTPTMPLDEYQSREEELRGLSRAIQAQQQAEDNEDGAIRPL